MSQSLSAVTRQSLASGSHSQATKPQINQRSTKQGTPHTHAHPHTHSPTPHCTGHCANAQERDRACALTVRFLPRTKHFVSSLIPFLRGPINRQFTTPSNPHPPQLSSPPSIFDHLPSTALRCPSGMEAQPGSCVVCLARQGKHDLIAKRISKHGPSMALQLQRLLAIADNNSGNHSCAEVHALMPYLGGSSPEWQTPSYAPGSSATGMPSHSAPINQPPILPAPVPSAPRAPAPQERRDASVPPTPPLPDARFATASGSGASSNPPGPPDWRTPPQSSTGTSSPSTDSPDTPPDRDHSAMAAGRLGSLPQLPPIVPLGVATEFAPPLITSRGPGASSKAPAAALANMSPSYLGSPKFAPQPTIDYEVAEPPKYPAWRQ